MSEEKKTRTNWSVVLQKKILNGELTNNQMKKIVEGTVDYNPKQKKEKPTSTPESLVSLEEQAVEDFFINFLYKLPEHRINSFIQRLQDRKKSFVERSSKRKKN